MLRTLPVTFNLTTTHNFTHTPGPNTVTRQRALAARHTPAGSEAATIARRRRTQGMLRTTRRTPGQVRTPWPRPWQRSGSACIYEHSTVAGRSEVNCLRGNVLFSVQFLMSFVALRIRPPDYSDCIGPRIDLYRHRIRIDTDRYPRTDTVSARIGDLDTTLIRIRHRINL